MPISYCLVFAGVHCGADARRRPRLAQVLLHLQHVQQAPRQLHPHGEGGRDLLQVQQPKCFIMIFKIMSLILRYFQALLRQELRAQGVRLRHRRRHDEARGHEAGGGEQDGVVISGGCTERRKRVCKSRVTSEKYKGRPNF